MARSRARAGTIARQRRVLSVMLLTLAVPLVIALATGWAAAWWAVVALLPVVCTYVAILMRTRRRWLSGRSMWPFSAPPAGPVRPGGCLLGWRQYVPLERMAAGGGGSSR